MTNGFLLIQIAIFLSISHEKGSYLQVKKYSYGTKCLYFSVSMLQCQIHSSFKREVMCWKTSSVQGIVRPPIG